jgi:hypothetical protein
MFRKLTKEIPDCELAPKMKMRKYASRAKMRVAGILLIKLFFSEFSIDTLRAHSC